MSVHLLPFNTKFRGTTNVTQHFDDIIKPLHNNVGPNGKPRNEHAVPLEDCIVMSAPKQPEPVKIDADDNENDKQQKDTLGDDDAVLLAHFRGRRLLGRRVNLAAAGAMGVVAVIPLETEYEQRVKLGIVGDDNNNNDNDVVAAAEQVEERPSTATTTAAAGAFPLGKKKLGGGSKIAQAIASAASGAVRRPREDEGEQQQQRVPPNDANGRPTEPHQVDVGNNNDQDKLQKPSSNNNKNRTKFDLGHVPAARGIVPLETFDRFTVWDHDRLSSTSLHPTVGVPLWFELAAALHGK